MADKKYPIDAKMIVEKSDIVAVISHYISIEKRGNEYRGVCPFHDDHDPSLHVSPDKKIFKCFVCNTGGNVIDFVKQYKHVSFIEAVKEVAEISGIKVDIHENPQTIRNRKLYEIMEEASKVYSLYLNMSDGQKAREYLKNRFLDDDVIKRFGIGLSNNAGDLLVKSLIEIKKYLPLDLQEIGLVGMNSTDKHYYDMFRGRIMFPLKDLSGNIVGFSGRIYDSKSEAKYVNSQENVIFRKSNVLYNYSDAVNEIKKKNQVIIFEGFMDVIAAYRAGVYNTIATMGTALTEDHIKTILKLTNNVTVCFDGDNAGINATKRAIALFTKYGVSVKAILINDDLDPDEYLTKYGKEKTYNLLVNENISAVDYLYIVAKKSLDTNDSSSIVAFQNSIYRLVNFFKSNALKTYLFGLMSKDLHMSIEDITYDYEHMDLSNQKDKYEVKKKDEIVNDYPPEVDINEDYIPEYIEYSDQDIADIYEDDYPDIKPKERYKKKGHVKSRYRNAMEAIINLSYKDKSICDKVKIRLGYDKFVDEINRSLLYHLYDYYKLYEKMNYDEFVKKLNPKEIEQMNKIINSPCIFIESSLDDYIDVLSQINPEKVQDDYREIAEVSGSLTPEQLEQFIKCKKMTTKIKTKKSKEGKK